MPYRFCIPVNLGIDNNIYNKSEKTIMDSYIMN